MKEAASWGKGTGSLVSHGEQRGYAVTAGEGTQSAQNTETFTSAVFCLYQVAIAPLASPPALAPTCKVGRWERRGQGSFLLDLKAGSLGRSGGGTDSQLPSYVTVCCGQRGTMP